jgi:hypothetical protein
MAVRRRVAATTVAALAALLAAGAVLALRSPDQQTDPAASVVPISTTAPSAPPVPAVSWVTVENRRPGTSGWRITHMGPANAIQGWADHVSAAAGERVRLSVSTTARRFRVQAYRMGWYGGRGARLVWQSPPLPGHRQPAPVRTPQTNMVATRWPPSLTIPVDQAWPPGVYLLKLVAATGQRYVPLTIRDDHSHAAEQGAGDLLGNELPLVRLVESLGLDVTYWTDIDLHRHPERLLAHRALVSLGHDEYWSTRMRRGAEAARANGVNLAFLGANAVYRHIRLRPSPAGQDREEVNYKPWSVGDDPAWKTDPSEVTTDWRRPPLNDPESRLLGAQYECNPVHAAGVVVRPSSWLLAGTGVRAGSRLPGLVGDEYDRVQPGSPRPPRVEVLLRSPVRCRGASFADTTYYTAAAGAGVFDAGTGSWVCQLARVCAEGRRSAVTARVVRAVTVRLLRAFARGPAGARHRP